MPNPEPKFAEPAPADGGGGPLNLQFPDSRSPAIIAVQAVAHRFRFGEASPTWWSIPNSTEAPPIALWAVE